jgi:hypothetical protein
VVVEVQLLDAQGSPFAGDDLETGHAEIVALLKASTTRHGL